MAGVAAITTAISTVASLGAGVAQQRAINEQNKAERRSRQLEQRQAALENARRRRQALAQQRIRAAEITQAGENQGIAGSSTVAGARGALVTQTASNIGFSQTQEAFNRNRAATLESGYQSAARFASFGNALGSISTASNRVGSFAAQNPTFKFSDLPFVGGKKGNT